MKMRDLLSIERVIPRLRAHDKRDALRKLAAHAARDAAVRETAIVRAVLECARLPAFGPGAGISLPHAFLAGLGNPNATFARLDPPIQFGAADGSSTDLVVLLLSPPERPGDHLRALACIARTLRDSEIRDLLREADSRDAIYVILCGYEQQYLSRAPWSADPASKQRRC